MRKRLTKVRYRGIRAAIVSLLLLVSLAVVSVAPKVTYAALADLYPFDLTTATAMPTAAPTPVPTQAPTPTAQPQPTTTPATPAPTAPTSAPPPQQNQGAGAPTGTAPNQAPTPIPTVAPTPTFTNAAPTATTANAPDSMQQQDMSGPLNTIFSPIGVTIMLLSVLGVAGVTLLLMRRKQPAPALTGQSAYNASSASADYAPFTPVPQAFSQTAQPAMAPTPAMTQQEIVLSSSEPGPLSPDLHSEVTEVHEVASASQAPGSDFRMPHSDLNPPRTDLPGPIENQANENKEKVPQPQEAAIMPSALPETPSLHNGDLSEQGHAELVSTDQLMAIIRQAQGGLFVIPEREQEKQTR